MSTCNIHSTCYCFWYWRWIPTGFKFYVVPHSYSSRLFLSTLVRGLQEKFDKLTKTEPVSESSTYPPIKEISDWIAQGYCIYVLNLKPLKCNKSIFMPLYKWKFFLCFPRFLQELQEGLLYAAWVTIGQCYKIYIFLDPAWCLLPLW